MAGGYETAYRFLVAAPGVDSLEQLNALTHRTLAPFGFASVSCVRIARAAEPVAPEGLFGVNAMRWGEAYLRERCALHDPAIPRVFSNDGPFTWSELNGRALSPRQTRVFGLAAELGFRDGLIVPVLGRHGDIAAVVAKSEMRLDLAPEARALAAAIAGAYAARGLGLLGMGATPPKPLSARERECLAWSARGKSDTLTSQILDLSAKTVRMHVENARRKLGVHSRQHAVLEAWRQGWLVDGAA